jgi:hypothetical protein
MLQQMSWKCFNNIFFGLSQQAFDVAVAVLEMLQ